MRNSHSFSVNYDGRADVLYLTAHAGPAARGEEDESGIVWRYDSHGTLMSATIMDFHELWTERVNELAEVISEKFHIPQQHATTVVKKAFEGITY